MKNISLTTIFILLIVCTVNGQDLIYTVNGEYNSNPLSLDSILVENLSNDTRLLFGQLPIQPDYKINLSSGEQEGPTGSMNHQVETPLAVVRNLPGNLTLAVRSTGLHHARLTVYNMQGQMLWMNPELAIRSGQLIDVYLPGKGIYIVEVITESGSRAYRATGSQASGSIGVTIDGEDVVVEHNLKSARLSLFNDFSFQVGDSLRVTAFRDGYYTRPVLLEITTSEWISFLFDISRVETDGISDLYVDLAGATDDPDSFDPATGEVQMEYTEETGSLQAGDIITVDTDTAGYLRKVVNITETGGTIVLETEQAYMNELFVDKAFKLKTDLIEPSPGLKSTGSIKEIAKALTDEQGYIHPVKVIYFNSDGAAMEMSAFHLKGTSDETGIHEMERCMKP